MGWDALKKKKVEGILKRVSNRFAFYRQLRSPTQERANALNKVHSFLFNTFGSRRAREGERKEGGEHVKSIS